MRKDAGRAVGGASPTALPAWLLILSALALGSCRGTPGTIPAPGESTAARVSPAPAEAALEEPCARAIREVLATPSLGGTAELDRVRADVLVAAKAEPVIFVRRPMRERATEVASALGERLERTAYPWELLRGFLPLFARNPRLGRAVLLSEGYLYAESPDLAWALVDLVQVHDLFAEDRVRVQRGEVTLWASRGPGGRYVWADGPERGRFVRLILFDRLGSEPPAPPLHRDLRVLRSRLHFDRARLRWATEDRLLLDLGYGLHWVPTLLRSRDAHLEVECESVSSVVAEAIENQRTSGLRHLRAVSSLRRAMLEQIDEGTLFDEPMTELGQQDGRLRPAWRWAYLAGKGSFRFAGDRYPVFDVKGRPIPPQVCLDFLLDTLERASGTWWRKSGEDPGRNVGGLDLEALGGLESRTAPGFLRFVDADDRRFEVKVHSADERFPIGDRSRLARELLDHRDDYRTGDMVMIHGWTPWDPHEMHYHSFFVYETDPVTGIPIVIAGNAGRPSLRTWRTESVRTPKRVFVRRIRPRPTWLEQILGTRIAEPFVPPLVAEPGALPLVIPRRR